METATYMNQVQEQLTKHIEFVWDWIDTSHGNTPPSKKFNGEPLTLRKDGDTIVANIDLRKSEVWWVYQAMDTANDLEKALKSSGFEVARVNHPKPSDKSSMSEQPELTLTIPDTQESLAKLNQAFRSTITEYATRKMDGPLSALNDTINWASKQLPKRQGAEMKKTLLEMVTSHLGASKAR